MKPNRSLFAFLLFVAFFFVIPGQIWVMHALEPWVVAVPTFGVAGLPSPLIMHLELSAVVFLLAAYIVINLLVALAFKLLQVYHYESVLERLAVFSDGTGLQGMARLTGLAALAGLVLAVALAPFGPTEGVALLSLLMAAHSFSVHSKNQPPLGPQPYIPQPSVIPASPPELSREGKQDSRNEVFLHTILTVPAKLDRLDKSEYKRLAFALSYSAGYRFCYFKFSKFCLLTT